LTNVSPGAPITAAQLYQDLTTASDHLPIVADYTIPLPTAPPLANFSAAPTNGIVALAVTFTDASAGTVTNWFWDFGDGSNTNVATNTTVHIYNAAGVYDVTEIVAGPGGASTNTVRSYITVQVSTLPSAQLFWNAGSLVLSWPTPGIPYQLLSAPTPTGPWSPDSSTLSTNGGSVSTSLTPTNDQRYYRLQGL
jgi:PKD repeat protein